MITGKSLVARGWVAGRQIGLAKRAADILLSANPTLTEEDLLARLDAVRAAPDAHLDDPLLGSLASELRRLERERERSQRRRESVELRPTPLPYAVWGREGIDPAALTQMDRALQLPVAVAGALMPDAHVGYGLPIGGVLATADAVIPYAVGVDIACRMRLSVYDVPPDVLEHDPRPYERALLDRTYFGAGRKNPDRPDHPVLHEDTWDDTRFLRPLKALAAQQLGTSGSGNHFVEWGSIEISVEDPDVGLPPGRYLALLSHSGSRGVGFKIANQYSTIAMKEHPGMEREVKHLAWLDLDDDAGREYWSAMELAGRFASANHLVIHTAVARAAGLTERAAVENHHNFAWRETVTEPDGTEVEAIVHRKGATPAGRDVLGVIPGSMGDPGFVVRGRGVVSALKSASHGAGRAMSRRAAFDRISRQERDTYLRERGITVLGGGTDESPQAYKRIETIIAAQSDLVDIIGRFEPKIVRMASEAGYD